MLLKKSTNFPRCCINMGNRGRRLIHYLLIKESTKEKNILQTTIAGSFKVCGHMNTTRQLQECVTNTAQQTKDTIYPRLLTEGCYRPTYNQGFYKTTPRGFYKKRKEENSEILRTPKFRVAEQENAGKREYFCVFCLLVVQPSHETGDMQN